MINRFGRRLAIFGAKVMIITSTTSAKTSGYGIPHRRNLLTLLWVVGLFLYQVSLKSFSN